MATTDLCDVAAVLPLIPLTADTDGRIAGLIPAASRQIRRRSGLTFGAVVDETRSVHCFGESTAWPKELRAVTAVKDDGGHPVTYKATDVDEDGHIRWLELDDPFDGRLLVTGTWGWDAIPSDVALMCAMTVADWYKRDQTATITPMGDVGYDGARRTRALPPYVEQMLQTYTDQRF